MFILEDICNLHYKTYGLSVVPVNDWQYDDGNNINNLHQAQCIPLKFKIKLNFKTVDYIDV